MYLFLIITVAHTCPALLIAIYSINVACGMIFNRPISQTVFMLSLALNGAGHLCATVYLIIAC